MNRLSPARGLSIDPLAPLLAWIWPGLGHIRLGQKRRGFLIMAGVLLLVLSGLFIGGLSVVDRKEQRLWFLAQGLCGPVAFAVDYANQAYVKKLPFEENLRATSLSHVHEIGTLYIALAGLMNLVVILDTLHPRRLADPTTADGEFVERRRSGGAG